MEWPPTGKFRNLDTTFRTDSTYEKDIMTKLPLTRNYLCKAEMEYHEKFGPTIVRIKKIALMVIIDICYTACHLETQTVAPTLTGFQGIKRGIKYLYIHPHKPIFYPCNYYDGSHVIRLIWIGNQVED